ncbi:MAG: hypothetical protein JXP34_00470 [Planctomycetes bacterium]|nr:hypothetical protein [Planctomycetota bacterium]
MARNRALLAVWLFALVVLPLRGADDPFEKKVDDAIDRGVAWLLERLEKDGWVNDNPLGTTAIEIYALSKSDISLDHPKMKEGLDRIAGRLPVGHTYSVALCLMALDAILHQMEMDQALLSGRGFVEIRPSKQIWERMRAGAAWLVSKRVQGKGSWNYNGEQTRYDNSNSQFAVLGLGVAAKRGIPIGPEIWTEIADHFIGDQQPDGPPAQAKPVFRRDAGSLGRKGTTGVRQKDPQQFSAEGDAKIRGWCYQEPKGAPTATMTCAGLSSLLIAREYLLRVPGACPPDKLKKIDQGIRDGYAWVTRTKGGMNFGGWHFYGLYSLEKVGDLGNVEKFDDWDWYRWAAENLIAGQKPDGHWGDDKDVKKARYQTAFALLVLNRATDLLSFTRPLFLSGRSGSQEVGGDLVYIPRLDAQVSVRRILRKLRFSPNKGVMRLAEDMVKAYPVEKNGELVKPLLELFGSPYKGIQVLAVDLLSDLTGMKSETPDPYRDWYAKWTELTAVVQNRDAAAAPKLREDLRTIDNPKLKMKVVDGLRVLRVRDAIGDLIDQLSAEDPEYRSRVYDAIAYLADKYLPFDARGSKAQRDRQIEAWRAWWEREGKAAK